MKKVLIFFLVFSLVVLAKPCLEKTLGFYFLWKVKKGLGIDLSFQSLLINGANIEINKLTFNKKDVEGFVEAAHFSFDVNYSKFEFFPRLVLKRPKIYVKKPLEVSSEMSSDFFPISIEEGKVFVGEIKSPLLFSYGDNTQEFKGRVKEGSFDAKVDEERVVLSFDRIDFSEILPYFKFFSFMPENFQINGKVNGSIIFPLSSEKIFCDLHVIGLLLKNEALCCSSKEVSLKLRGPYSNEKTFWENSKVLNTFISLSDARVFSSNNPWKIHSLNGFFFSDSFKKFQSEFSAVAENQGHSVPILLEGKDNLCSLDFLKTRVYESGKGQFFCRNSSFLFEWENMTPEKKRILDLFISPLFPDQAFDFTKGRVDAKISFNFIDSVLEEIELFHLIGSDLYLEKGQMNLELESIRAKGVYQVKEFLPLEGSLVLEKGKGKIGGVEINPISLDFCIENKVFLPSTVSCSINGVHANAKIEGKVPFFTSNIALEGNVNSFFGIEGDYLVQSHINISNREEGVFYRGYIEPGEDRFSIFAKTKNLLFDKEDPFKNLQFFECECERFDVKALDRIFKNKQFSGNLFGKVAWEDEKFYMNLDLDHINILTPEFILKFEEKVTLKNAIFDPRLLKFSLQAPFKKGFFYFDEYSLSFSDIGGDLFYKDDLFSFTFDQVVGEGFSFKGKAFYDPRGKFDLDLKNISGTVEKAQDFLQKLRITENRFDFIKGEVFVDSLIYSYALGNPFFMKINGGFANGSGQLTDIVSYENLKGVFSFDTVNNVFLCSDTVAEITVPGEEKLFLSVEHFTKKENEYSFDFLLDQSFLEIARLKGIGKDFAFIFDDSSHYYGSQLENFCFSFSENAIDKFHLYTKQSFSKRKVKLLQNIMGVHFPLDLKGDIDFHFNFTEDKGNLYFKGKNLTLFNESLKDFSISVEKSEDTWTVIEGKLNDAFLSGTYKNRVLDAKVSYLDEFFLDFKSKMTSIESWDIESLSLKASDTSLLFRGNLLLDFSKNHPFSADCDISLLTKGRLKNYTFTNSTPFNCKFSFEDQLQIGGVNLYVFSDDVKTPACFKTKVIKVDFQKQKLSAVKAYLSIPRDIHFGEKLFNKNLGEINANLDLEIYRDRVGMSIHSGYIQEKEDRVKNQFKTLKIEMSKDSLAFSGEYLFGRSYLPFQGNMFLSPSFKGNFNLFTPLKKVNDPLSFYWHFEEGIIIDYVSGSFSGIDAEFCRTDIGTLVGKASIDFSKLADYMEPRIRDVIINTLEMKEGYTLKGTLEYDPQNLLSNSFSGYMTGKDFSFFGYNLQTLFSEVHWSKKGLFIDDLKMSDEGGMLLVEQLYFRNKNEKTYLNIPKVSIKDIRPSLLRESGKSQPQSDLDPLIIKSITVENIHGDVNDEASIKGKGTLNFINSFNRGKKNLFDLPSEVIGKIFGLDLELLIPVCGNLDFEIRDKKCLFTDLRDTFSENKRSQFFLFEKMTPYMDFDANLHLYIKMKQFVLFKFTEQMIISLSGSMYDPKINLENKQQFDVKHN